MKRKAFTLLELLLVIAIMGYMGTIAVGGYRAMRRGMEERSVMQNVSQFIRSAYQRAQIDRQPVNVYFWNETLKQSSEDEPIQVVGKAVAVRRSGRLTKVSGNYLFDEFGDLRFSRLVLDEDESTTTSTTDDGPGVYLYAINGDESGSRAMRSTVAESTKRLSGTSEPLLLGGSMRNVVDYAYVVKDAGGVSWKAGMAYGFEFDEMQLPHNYIFGNNYSRSISTPIAREGVIRFTVGANSGNGVSGGIASGSGTINVYSLRPGASGAITAQRVGVSERPNTQQSN